MIRDKLAVAGRNVRLVCAELGRALVGSGESASEGGGGKGQLAECRHFE